MSRDALMLILIKDEFQHQKKCAKLKFHDAPQVRCAAHCTVLKEIAGLVLNKLPEMKRKGTETRVWELCAATHSRSYSALS